jgi:1-deoxy-D-xylulose-5-phosphate reductoisomerase
LNALAEGGTLPTVLNAADEVAVSAYLDGRIRFSEIPRVVSETMSAHEGRPADDVAQILTADAWARETASRVARGNGKEG